MIEHANMSVCASDAFMAAVKADLPWDLKWQGHVVRTVRARDIWDAICAAAWTTAEPGLVFMERAQKEAQHLVLREHYAVLIHAANSHYRRRRLQPRRDQPGALRERRRRGCWRTTWRATRRYATRFLDNVIDATPYFSELHVKMQREGTRRTGLGTMGLADALIKMGVAYGSRRVAGGDRPHLQHHPRRLVPRQRRPGRGEGRFGRFDARQISARAPSSSACRSDMQDGHRRARHPQRRPADPGADGDHQPAGGRLQRHRAGLRLRHEARRPPGRAHHVPPAATRSGCRRIPARSARPTSSAPKTSRPRSTSWCRPRCRSTPTVSISKTAMRRTTTPWRKSSASTRWPTTWAARA